MAILADVYVGSPDEAVRYGSNPKSFAPNAAQWKGFTVLEFSTLWSILEGREWDAETLDAFEDVPTGGDGEATISRHPDALLQRLIAADAAQREAASEEWAATDEIDEDPDDLRDVIEELVRLARTARSSRKGLYLWSCT